MSKIELGGHELNLRLTKKQIKNAKIKFNIDLRVMDLGSIANEKAMLLMQDPVFMTDCFYAFYEEQLNAAGITQDKFDDLIDETTIGKIREGFIDACAAFFPLVRMLHTTFAASLVGPQNLLPASQT